MVPGGRPLLESDADFIAAFENCTLPYPAWTHEAHLRMAWIYLRHNRLIDVIPKVREGIQRLNLSRGNPTGYHETVTLAFLRLVADRLGDGSVQETFVSFKERNPDLFASRPGILARYYSQEILDSADARLVFVEPDLDALPES
jgi:hypothetical protein